MEHIGEKELQVWAALARAFLSAQGIPEFCQRALDELVAFFGLDWGVLYLLQSSELVLCAHHGLPEGFVSQASPNPRHHPVLGPVLNERNPLFRKAFASPETKEEGLTAVAYLPLLVGEKELGVLALGSRRAWEPSPQEMAVLWVAAQVLSLGLARELQRAEAAGLLERYRYFAENELFGVYIIQDERFVFVNEELARIGGYSKDDLLGRPYWEVVHPEDREMVRRNLAARLKGEPAPQRYRLRALTKDGRPKVVEIQAWAVRFSGRPAVQGIVQDVTIEAEAERLWENLLAVAEEILAGTEVSLILHRVAQAVVEHSPFRRAVVSIYDPQHNPPLLGPVMALATAGLSREEEERLRVQGSLPPQDRPLAFQERFRIGRSYYIPHDQVPWDRKFGLPGRRPSDGWYPDDFLLIPLRGKAGIIGHISVDEPVPPKLPTLAMLAPLELFADLAALAVERAFQIEELRKHKEWLRGAFRLAHELSRFSSVEALLPAALETLRNEVRYEFGAILLREGEELVVAAAHSDLPGPRFRLGERIPLGKGIVGWVAAYRQPLRVEDVSEDPRYLPVHLEIRAELAVPIVLGRETLGVLDVESVEKGRFRPEDEEFLQAVADLLAVAMESLRAHEALRELSYRDPLTNLYNRRYLFEVLGQEIRRAQRYGHPLSLVLLDLDNFRDVNNRYGHAKGDEVLRGVAELLLRNLRSCDYVFRYGGDEFLLLLPETDEAGAEAAVKRVRGKLQAWSRAMDLALVLNFSAGVASYDPPNPRSPEELLREADVRLYDRKCSRSG